jgi:FkbM family methyltransferase
MTRIAKALIKRTLQRLLGFENYLYAFALFTHWRLRYGLVEKQFPYFVALIPEEGTILDIGANIGVMSTMLSRARPRASVISFEPIPENIRVFKRVQKHYKLSNVTLHEVALSDQGGHIQMVMPVIDNVPMHGLSKVVEEKDHGITYEVRLCRLDDIPELNEPGLQIKAIKIDVENHEHLVFQGGRKLLAKHLPLIYTELWDTDNRVQSLELLRGLGYTAKIYENGRLVDYAGQTCKNFILIPPHYTVPAGPRST